MLGLLYLLLCFTTGWAICTYAFPGLDKLTQTAYDKSRISVSPYLLFIPAWFVTGTLILTWAVYLLAFLFAGGVKPLSLANAIVIPIALTCCVATIYFRHRDGKKHSSAYLTDDNKALRWEMLLLTGTTVLAGLLMWTTFFVKGDQLKVGVSVFSDFSPHIGMIRSFSYGNNFPTSYSHFAGEDIKYHFIFQFLVGNLEYLGLRLDYAFNLPSMISFISAFMLLYLLAVKITGKLAAGILTCLFFAFRSSKTLFTYLSRLPEGTNVFRELMENIGFISDTPNEDWGLWNLNVYANQRHLAFGLTAMLFVLILFLPLLYEMFEDTPKNFKSLFLTKEAWLVKDYRTAVASGILLGSLTFFHGAAVIAGLLILFVVALLSRRRLEFLIMAAITVILSFLQTRLFIDGSALDTKFLFGFIAEHKTLFGVLSYLERLLGILPLVLLAALCFERKVNRYILLAFLAPLAFAFTISMTVDVTVNHKYIMMSCMLLGIFAASLITVMLEKKELLIRMVAVLLIVALTGTGFYDFTTVIRKNRVEAPVSLDLNSPLTAWVDQYSDSRDIFLTANYALNQFVLGGAMLYQGHQYYAWSAGYDTNYRDTMVRKMYGASTPERLDSLVKEAGIRYIVVDRDNRISMEYNLNENNIRNTYECVWEDGEGEWKLSIYDTQKPIKQD